MGCCLSTPAQPRAKKPEVRVIHRCTSNHPGCFGVSLVSPTITLQDGSKIKVAWAPCGLNEAKGVVSEIARNPMDAELLRNPDAPQPVPPEMSPGYMTGGGAGAPAAGMEPDFDDDMVYDRPHPGDNPYAGNPYPGDPYAAGENIEMEPMPPFGGEDFHMGGEGVGYAGGGQEMPLHEEFSTGEGMGYAGGGQEIPLNEEFYRGEEGMGFAGGPDIAFGAEEYGGGSGMGFPGTAGAAGGASGSRSEGSWAGSTVPPAARPPRAKWVQNREENFYQETGTHGGYPAGVAVARERERSPATAAGYTATAENYNEVRVSRQLR